MITNIVTIENSSHYPPSVLTYANLTRDSVNLKEAAIVSIPVPRTLEVPSELRENFTDSEILLSLNLY